jgi:hypothetical protein
MPVIFYMHRLKPRNSWILTYLKSSGIEVEAEDQAETIDSRFGLLEKVYH